MKESKIDVLDKQITELKNHKKIYIKNLKLQIVYKKIFIRFDLMMKCGFIQKIIFAK